MKVYISNVMFEKSDIQYNLYLAELIRSVGIEVYCPNENLSINDKTQVGITPEMIYDTDIDELLKCNVLLCKLCNDPGVMWEAGFMDSLSKINPNQYYGCIGLTTDIRWDTNPNINLTKVDNQAFYFNGFVVGGLKKSLGIVYNEEELIRKLIVLKDVR